MSLRLVQSKPKVKKLTENKSFAFQMTVSKPLVHKLTPYLITDDTNMKLYYMKLTNKIIICLDTRDTFEYDSVNQQYVMTGKRNEDGFKVMAFEEVQMKLTVE